MDDRSSEHALLVYYQCRYARPLDVEYERLLFEAAQLTHEKWETITEYHRYFHGRICYYEDDLVFAESTRTEAVNRLAIDALWRTYRLARAAPPASATAPRIGEVLIGLFCGRTLREAVLGDLAEKYVERALTLGPKKARVWYWWQVARSCGAFSWRCVRRLIELDEVLRRIGL